MNDLYKVKNQLFMGKVSDVIGFEKTVELAKEVDNTIKNIESLCKNCKHWEISEIYHIKDTRIGKCKRIGMFVESTELAYEESNDWNDFDLRVLSEENKDDKAFVKDLSDYKGFLLTLESFGCNQFEKNI